MRRELAATCLGGVAGAALLWWAASQSWLTVTRARPTPLPSVTETQTGTQLAVWLPAVGFVAIAASIALIATSGLIRRIVGLMLIGAGVAGVAGAVNLISKDSGERAVAAPTGATLGATLVAAVGVVTLLRAGSWPKLSGRYERKPTTKPTNMWEALDQGQDPTTDG